jgi:hypothetical protein
MQELRAALEGCTCSPRKRAKSDVKGTIEAIGTPQLTTQPTCCRTRQLDHPEPKVTHSDEVTHSDGSVTHSDGSDSVDRDYKIRLSANRGGCFTELAVRRGEDVFDVEVTITNPKTIPTEVANLLPSSMQAKIALQDEVQLYLANSVVFKTALASFGMSFQQLRSVIKGTKWTVGSFRGSCFAVIATLAMPSEQSVTVSTRPFRH